MKDELDELIEKEKIPETPPVADPPAGDPPPPKTGDAPPPPNAGDPPPPKTETTPAAKPTPKEILGLEEDATWDGVKSALSEVNDLRQKVQLAESLPKTVFTNDKVAGFNEFLKNNPEVADAPNAYAVFESVLAATPEDSLKVLTTSFILKNPGYAGKESVVTNMLSQKYKLNEENLPEAERDFHTVQMNSDAKVAFKEITGLRESLKSPSAPEPVDIAVRQAEWKSSIETELGAFNKLPIPIQNAETGKPELYLDFEIPKETVDRFVEEATKVYSRTGPVTDVVKKQIKTEFIKEYLYGNFQQITHAIKTKAATEERLLVEAEYDGAGKLKTGNKDAPATPQEVDPYDAAFGKM